MIGERIKYLREKKGLTQKQFSKESGINISTIASYEREFREPGIDIIIKLTHYFGVTADYLIGASDYIGAAEEKIGEKTRLTEESIDMLGSLGVETEFLNQFIQSVHFSEFISSISTYADSVVSDNAGFAVDLLDVAESLKNKISAGEDASDALGELTSLSHRIYNTFKSGGSNSIEADMLENIKKLAISIASEMRDANKGDNDGDRSETR